MRRSIVKLDPEETVLDLGLPVLDFDMKAPEFMEEDEDLMLEETRQDVSMPRGRYNQLFFN